MAFLLRQKQCDCTSCKLSIIQTICVQQLLLVCYNIIHSTDAPHEPKNRGKNSGNQFSDESSESRSRPPSRRQQECRNQSPSRRHSPSPARKYNQPSSSRPQEQQSGPSTAKKQQEFPELSCKDNLRSRFRRSDPGGMWGQFVRPPRKRNTTLLVYMYIGVFSLHPQPPPTPTLSILASSLAQPTG